MNVDGGTTQGHGQVDLAGTGATDEDKMAGLVQEGAPLQFAQLRFITLLKDHRACCKTTLWEHIDVSNTVAIDKPPGHEGARGMRWIRGGAACTRAAWAETCGSLLIRPNRATGPVTPASIQVTWMLPSTSLLGLGTTCPRATAEQGLSAPVEG